MSWRSMLMATAVASADPELEVDGGDVLEITEDAARDVRLLVRRLLTAFRKADAQTAWSLCSAAIHETFETPGRLLSMVQRAYPPFTELRQLRFGAWTLTPQGVGLHVDLRDDEGDWQQALVLVQRDRDVGWRIHGALLLANAVDALAEAA